jgi:hypothetical protein
MIKIRVKPLLAALALVGISSPSLAANNMVTVPTLSGGFMVGVSGLYFVPGPVSNTVYGSHVTTILSGVTTGITTSVLNTTHYVTGPYVSAHSLETDPSYRWGFALHLGYVFPGTGNDVMLNWNHLNTSQTDEMTVAGINPSTTNFFITGTPQTPNFPTQTIFNNSGEFIAPFFGETDLTTGLSSLGNTAPYTVAYGRSSTQWNAVDLNFGQHLNIGGNFDLRLSGGVVWARINQELEASYAGVGTTSTTTITTLPFNTSGDRTTIVIDPLDFQRSNTYLNEESTFRGFGPEIGFDGHYCITNTNFGLVGHLGGQMLIGTTDTDLYYLTVNSGQRSRTATTIPVVGATTTATTILGYNSSVVSNYLSDSQNHRLVPEIDANLGIDYTYTFANTYAHDCNSSLVVELGYQGRKYFNALRTFDDANAIETLNVPVLSSTNHRSEDVFFHGPFLSVKFFA